MLLPSHPVIPSNTVLEGSVDDVPMICRIDLNEPLSRIRRDVVSSSSERFTYKVREVVLQNMDEPYHRSRIILLPIDSQDTDVLLGRDWYNICSGAGTSENMDKFPKVEELFDRRHQRHCLFTTDLDAAHAIMAQHCVEWDKQTLEECQIMLLRHMLSGECVDAKRNRGGACRAASMRARMWRRQDYVSYLVAIILAIPARFIYERDIRLICLALGFPVRSLDHRSGLSSYLREYTSVVNTLSTEPASDEQDIECMDLPDLKALAYTHALDFRGNNIDDLRLALYEHFRDSRCVDFDWDRLSSFEWHAGRACIEAKQSANISNADPYVVIEDARVHVRIKIIERSLISFGAKALKRMATVMDIPMPEGRSPGAIRRAFGRYLTTLKVGKFKQGSLPAHSRCEPSISVEAPRSRWTHASAWPCKVPETLKEKIVRLFKSATGKGSTYESTCAICGARYTEMSGRKSLDANTLDRGLLKANLPLQGEEITGPRDKRRSAVHAICPFGSGPLQGLVLDKSAIKSVRKNGSLDCCRTCHDELAGGRLPQLALANNIAVGDIPPELEGLTPVEEMLIARYRSKCCIVQLKEGSPTAVEAQRALKGHVIIFPQQTQQIAAILPPPVDEMTTYICVIFVGSSKPSRDWILNQAKPLLVRRDRVSKALRWLKDNNVLYSDIEISESRMNQLPESEALPFHVQYQECEGTLDSVMSTYIPNLEGAGQDDLDPGKMEQISFESVVVANVDGSGNTNSMRSAAMRHLKTPGKGFLEVPHAPDPVNEFNNPDLFPLLYPTLFPYGIGGIEDASRRRRLSLQKHVRHLFCLADRRFQEHYSFMFTAFNIIQRREALLHTRFKVDAPNFERIAEEITCLSPEAIHRVTDRVACGDTITANGEEERRVLRLMREVKMVTRHVPGSSASRLAMRNEIRGLMISCGTPSYFITINPADVYNPLVKFLSGKEIDIDNMLPEDVPNYKEQSILIARNPAIAAKFFNLYMKAFISCVLGFDSNDDELRRNGGILGKVTAYYGCVESQGRGSLHCHMVIWIDGALNPNEIRSEIKADPNGQFVRRLIEMLDDTISNEIPYVDQIDADTSTSTHPCSVRGANPSHPDYQTRRKPDIARLVQQCQVHSHTFTCYKYWKGPPESKDCRFNLDEKNVRPISVVDPETGEVQLRCLNGLVNNFNETIIEAVRCNMDIKFIGSGQSAKAVLFYITDYITKSQLRAHVAFAALELAVRKLGQINVMEDQITVHAKRLLQKCAYAMISHQELSGQQVASYLLGYGDHFTSHMFRGLWWTAFEKLVDRKLQTSHPLSTNDNGEGLDDDTTFLDETEATDDDEVIIDVDDGYIVPKAGQVADYLYRGPALDCICIWDFVAQFDKKRSRKRRRSSTAQASVRSSPCTDNACRVSAPNSSTIEPLQASNIVTASVRRIGRVGLLKDHVQSKTHILKMRRGLSRLVPVPMGPALPRRDREEHRERYCKMMLILFKPWRKPEDLKSPNVLWQDAFRSFQQGCEERIIRIMDNMQLLHECKDSRDDHFAQQRNRSKLLGGGIISSWADEEADEIADELYGDDIENDIVLHLNTLFEKKKKKTAPTETSAYQCVVAAKAAGLFSRLEMATGSGANALNLINESDEGRSINIGLSQNKDDLETAWRAAYEQNRLAHREKRMADLETETETGNSHMNINQDPNIPYLRSANTDGNQVKEHNATITSTLSAGTARADNTVQVMISDLEREFTLNTEQARAFRIICGAADNCNGEPSLKMFIGGSGGTGKSRVLAAVSEFFKRRNESRRLRIAAYTGVAAHNIGGITLHSALHLMSKNRRRRTSQPSKTKLMLSWRGVDFLFVDEISMIGCQSMVDIHEALVDAKDCEHSFGGINVIFAGDFAQLPPVGQTKLYARLNTASIRRGGTDRGQRNIFGRLLWLQVDVVVILKQCMRQSGSRNRRFVRLLENLRLGQCDESDYQLLLSRTVDNVLRTSSCYSWIDSPIIVADNLAKDMLNEAAAEGYAAGCHQDLQWYYATDTHKGQILDDPRVLEELGRYHSGLTAYRLQRLPLVPGMPVILSQNYDVEGGIVNGTFGSVDRVRYVEDSQGRRHGKSCIIKVSNYTGDALPLLDNNEMVALEDTVDIQFVHPFSFKKLQIKRRQLPILPAFAVTVYKAQGLTLPRAVLDIQSCSSTEAAYVMLSRVQSLEGVLILRPFDKSKIAGGQTPDSKVEFDRLAKLDLQTQLKYVETAEEFREIQATVAKRLVPLLEPHPGTDSATLLDEYQRAMDQYYKDKYLLPQNAVAGRKRKRSD